MGRGWGGGGGGVCSLAAGGGGGAHVKPVAEAGDAAPGFFAFEGREGIVVAEAAGGTVEMRVLETGETVSLADGERVQFAELFAGPGLGRAEAQVVARGLTGVIPNPRLALEDRVVALPAQGLVVFSAVAECAAQCAWEISVVSRDGWRVSVTREAVSAAVSVAPHPRGRELAIGAHQLWVVSVPQGKVRTWKEFTAPAYDPNGVLVVRGAGGNDGVFELGEFGNGVLLHTEPGTPPGGAGGQPAADPAPVVIGEGGRTLSAVFRRGPQSVERTIER